jgi:hypothetical protein
MNRYPQQTLDPIIDHLHDDHAALRTCAFAVRSFQSAVHHHLFWRAHMHNVFRCHALLQFLQYRPGLGTQVRLLILDNTDDSPELSAWLWSPRALSLFRTSQAWAHSRFAHLTSGARAPRGPRSRCSPFTKRMCTCPCFWTCARAGRSYTASPHWRSLTSGRRSGTPVRPKRPSKHHFWTWRLSIKITVL